jgi:hypothetical protein
MLSFNQGLRHETYHLINRQFERKLQRHPPKNIEEKIFEDKLEYYTNVFMINEPVNWKESKNNLKTHPYTQTLYHGDAADDDFGVRYHLSQIRS